MTDIAGYVMKTALATLPGSEIVLGGGGKRSADYQKPLLRVPKYGDIELDVGLVIMTIRAFRHEDFDRPGVLKEMVDSWDISPADATDEPPDLPTFDVSEIDDLRFTHQIGINEEVAFAEERRIEALTRKLADFEAIDEVVHEDRELILVRAPEVPAAELRRLVIATWASLDA